MLGFLETIPSLFRIMTPSHFLSYDNCNTRNLVSGWINLQLDTIHHKEITKQKSPTFKARDVSVSWLLAKYIIYNNFVENRVAKGRRCVVPITHIHRTHYCKLNCIQRSFYWLTENKHLITSREWVAKRQMSFVEANLQVFLKAKSRQFLKFKLLHTLELNSNDFRDRPRKYCYSKLWLNCLFER